MRRSTSRPGAPARKPALDPSPSQASRPPSSPPLPTPPHLLAALHLVHGGQVPLEIGLHGLGLALGELLAPGARGKLGLHAGVGQGLGQHGLLGLAGDVHLQGGQGQALEVLHAPDLVGPVHQRLERRGRGEGPEFGPGPNGRRTGWRARGPPGAAAVRGRTGDKARCTTRHAAGCTAGICAPRSGCRGDCMQGAGRAPKVLGIATGASLVHRASSRAPQHAPSVHS